MTILSAIVSLFSSTNTETEPAEPTGPTGAEAIRTAVQEYQTLSERDYSVTFGQPYVIEEGGQFFNDPKVAVPILNGPFKERQKLVFDIPRGEDYELEEFNQLLTLFGLTFETMEELAGEEAPVRFVAGNLVVDWEAIDPPESEADDFSEDEESESDTEKSCEKVDEDEDEDEGEKEEEETVGEPSGVNVEEKTVTVGDDDE